MADEKSLQEIRAENERLKKQIADTKADHTRTAQANAALRAEITVLDEVGVSIPADIEALKTEDPQKYLTELKRYTDDVASKRFDAATKAVATGQTASLDEVASKYKLTGEDIKGMIPPMIYDKYTSGDVSAEKLVELARQYSAGASSVASPITTPVFDLTGAAGGSITPDVKQTKDKTLDKNNYII